MALAFHDQVDDRRPASDGLLVQASGVLRDSAGGQWPDRTCRRSCVMRTDP